MKIAEKSPRIKKSKVLVSIVATVLIVGITAVGTLFFLNAQSMKSAGNGLVAGSIYKTSVKNEQTDIVGIPIRLKIPSINVDAAIESLGLTTEGDMDAPDGPDNTGWYNAGPRPGQIGSAVIDGHFGWKNSKPAVFDKLHTLRKGDLVLIEDESKQTRTFEVNEIRMFAPDDDATEVFRSSDNKSHLNLITCQGVWNKDLESYDTRLVVFADLRD